MQDQIAPIGTDSLGRFSGSYPIGAPPGKGSSDGPNSRNGAGGKDLVQGDGELPELKLHSLNHAWSDITACLICL